VLTDQGIAVDAWVRIEEDCPIACDVVGGEAQFRFGGRRSDGIDLIVTEQGLENIVQACSRALETMRT
jgi:hypothetical protein